DAPPRWWARQTGGRGGGRGGGRRGLSLCSIRAVPGRSIPLCKPSGGTEHGPPPSRTNRGGRGPAPPPLGCCPRPESRPAIPRPATRPPTSDATRRRRPPRRKRPGGRVPSLRSPVPTPPGHPATTSRSSPGRPSRAATLLRPRRGRPRPPQGRARWAADDAASPGQRPSAAVPARRPRTAGPTRAAVPWAEPVGALGGNVAASRVKARPVSQRGRRRPMTTRSAATVRETFPPTQWRHRQDRTGHWNGQFTGYATGSELGRIRRGTLNLPEGTIAGGRASGRLIQVGHPLALQPLGRDVDLDAPDADRAPHSLAALARDVLVVLVQVQLHRVRAALEARNRALHPRISRSNSGK